MADWLGIDTALKGTRELAEEINKLLGDMKLQPLTDQLLPDASKEEALEFLRNLGQEAIKPKIDFGAWADQIDTLSKAMEDKDMTVNLNGTESIDKIRNEIENGAPYKIDIVPSTKTADGKDSNSTLEAIRSAVETIRTLVAKIEPKLPQTALAQ